MIKAMDDCYSVFLKKKITRKYFHRQIKLVFLLILFMAFESGKAKMNINPVKA